MLKPRGWGWVLPHKIDGVIMGIYQELVSGTCYVGVAHIHFHL